GSGKACRVFGDSNCNANEYCLFNDQCGKDGAGGKCAPKLSDCADNWAPVCGCNRTTYGNACKAAAAGISVRSEGSCFGERDSGMPPLDAGSRDAGARDAGSDAGARDAGHIIPCGGDAGTGCDNGQYCSFDLDHACGANHAVGECQVLPQICPGIVKPVC